MNLIQVDAKHLKEVISCLQTAIEVCYNSPDNEQKGYPYATGWSRSAMQTSIQTLQSCLKE